MPEEQPTWQKTVSELVKDQTLDQTLAGATSTGLMLATLWTTLTKSGVHDCAATEIVCCYLSEVMQRGQQG